MSRSVSGNILAVPPDVEHAVGLLSADQLQHDLFTLQGVRAGNLRLRRLQLPAAPAVDVQRLPHRRRVASVIGVVVGEQFFRQDRCRASGIVMALPLHQRSCYPQVFGGLIDRRCALGIVVFMFFGWLSRVVVGRWHHAIR